MKPCVKSPGPVCDVMWPRVFLYVTLINYTIYWCQRQTVNSSLNNKCLEESSLGGKKKYKIMFKHSF